MSDWPAAGAARTDKGEAMNEPCETHDKPDRGDWVGPEPPARASETWRCPEGMAHLYEIGLNPECVEAIQRLTVSPEANDPALADEAARYALRTGGETRSPARPGELIPVQCAKCGRPAIIGIGWERPAQTETR